VANDHFNSSGQRFSIPEPLEGNFHDCIIPVDRFDPVACLISELQSLLDTSLSLGSGFQLADLELLEFLKTEKSHKRGNTAKSL